MEFVKAMKIKSEICKAHDDCFKCPLKCCGDFLTHSSEEAEKVFEEWELDAEWRTLPKGSIIIVNIDYDGEEGIKVIRVFDHYDVQEKEVFYVVAGSLKGGFASAPIHHCKIYEVGDYDG